MGRRRPEGNFVGARGISDIASGRKGRRAPDGSEEGAAKWR